MTREPLTWTTPYGPKERLYESSNGRFVVVWEDEGTGACPPDWLDADGDYFARGLLDEGYRRRGRWQVYRINKDPLDGEETSEAIGIAPNVTEGKHYAERWNY